MRNGLKDIQWCPGCGNTLIIGALNKALKDLNIHPNNTIIVSGIGCSGKSSQYINGYGAETLHGRVLPFATGVKISKPDMHVIAISGDGDGLGIGMGHFIHACRRNINITYLIFNNENYALTTGQASPTTPLGVITKTTPNGNNIKPIESTLLAHELGVKYVKKTSSSNYLEMVKIFKEAVLFDGFSLVDINQTCPSFKKW